MTENLDLDFPIVLKSAKKKCPIFFNSSGGFCHDAFWGSPLSMRNKMDKNGFKNSNRLQTHASLWRVLQTCLRVNFFGGLTSPSNAFWRSSIFKISKKSRLFNRFTPNPTKFVFQPANVLFQANGWPSTNINSKKSGAATTNNSGDVNNK